MESNGNNFKHIKIKDFGPIKEANIEIAPLTVFVGPNSSGKSFAALLIHSLLNPNKYKESVSPLQFGMDSLKCLLKNNVEKFKEFDDNIKKAVDSDKSNIKCFKMSKGDFDILVNDGIKNYYNYLVEDKLKDYFELEDLFGLLRLNHDSFEVSLDDFNFYFKDKLYCYDSCFDNLNNDIEIVNNDNFLFKINFDEDIVSISLNSLLIKSFEDDSEDNIIYAISLYIYLAEYIFRSLIKENSHYIPAARDELVKNKEKAISNQIKGVSDFSKVQEELSLNLLNSKPDKKKAFLYDLACEMEQEIIGGSIEIVEEEHNSRIVFVDNDNDFECGTNLLSTSIMELIPLILYLKYEVNKGDTLIIEEPEAHIHPANQRLLVKYLVEAVNAGLKIIFTTHSDFIIEQLNNLIRLGNASKDVFKKHKYFKKNVLKPNKINIYHFKDDERNNYSYVAKKLSISNNGFNEENFSKVSQDLYGESIDIIEL